MSLSMLQEVLNIFSSGVMHSYGAYCSIVVKMC